MITESIKNRFHQKYVPVTESGCWLWDGCTSGVGYGQLYVGKRDNGSSKAENAHRLSWMIHNGDIPYGLHVLHKCDNRLCVNPNHLFLGTNSDNIKDSMSKNRRKGVTRKRPTGLKYKSQSEESKEKRRKTDTYLRELIRREHGMGLSQRHIAKRHGISQPTVCNILKGEF